MGHEANTGVPDYPYKDQSFETEPKQAQPVPEFANMGAVEHAVERAAGMRLLGWIAIPTAIAYAWTVGVVKDKFQEMRD